MQIVKPSEQEYNEFYKGYIDLVKADDLLTGLIEGNEEIVALFNSIPTEIEVFRYDAKKWSIKEVLAHIIDLERYLSYKAFVSLRNDLDTVLAHPKRDHYLFHTGTENRNIRDMVHEFKTVRSATISLFKNANLSQVTHIVNHVNPVHAISARALGFAIAGHGSHHVQIIRERYLKVNSR